MLVRPLLFAVGCKGPAALEELYRVTGLTAEIAVDADARIDADVLRRAWREAIRVTGDSLLPLHLATAMPPGALGIVEYLVRCAPTVGEALELGLRYLNILDEVGRAALVDGERDDELDLVVVVDSPIPHESCFAAVVGQGRVLVGPDFRPVAVELSHHPDGPLEAYEAFFRAPVRFGAPATRLVLSRASLAAPVATADPNLLPILVRHAEELTARFQGPAPTTTEQARAIIARLLRCGEHDVEQVAAALGVTARSLQRRLKDEGTTFQAVRDELRCELALTYLRGGATTAEVSFLLGFSEASAFFRAFKRWTGTTPAEVQRRSHDA
ncbi:MAG TPA: AraC family transcriptional regulator [Kofleriaceae bacterium]|nr:AraC family transcriptional regulator [Kofleriaceae bacterium]